MRRLETCAQEGREAFDASPILQDAAMRTFEVIGETVKQLSPDLRDRYADVEWRRVAGFRDVLIHNYMGVDLDEVWNVIEKDLPRLKRTVKAMLEDVNR
ncbi:HepT-like ribonuclease domain-containing protein [Salinibacter grassmerensis]|uniref:HepT-like ribonuclease domain-containing protein n=1 Tax=Salinibacter grassmerensis TaxID=3040353 RepID=UPI0021E78144|nr:HepT-like ribonuclease domain-containing protein [Salinibacter grassmerensis]